MRGVGTLCGAIAPLALATILLGRSAAAEPKAKVLPFAEDAKEAANPKTRPATRPAPMPTGKPSFQPRFRSPNPRQAAHEEPSESTTKSEPTSDATSGPKLEAAQDEPAAKPKDAKLPQTAHADSENPKSLMDE